MKYLPLLFLSLFVAVGIALPQQHVSAEVNSYTVSDDDTVETLSEKLNELLKRYESVRKQLQDRQSSSGSPYKSTQHNTASSTSTSTPNPAACSFPWTKTLVKGARGSEVSDLQKSLKAHGFFSDEPSGYYGDQTEAAVQKFQKSYNIVSSGNAWTTGYGSFGTQTRSVLKRVCGGTSYHMVTSFDIDDVKSVTKKTVDPIPNAIDDEYTLYTITLESNKVIKVKACGFCTLEMREKQFTDAGYEGDVSALIALATTEEDDEEEEEDTTVELEATPTSGDAPLSVVFTVQGEEGKSYTLDFGDRTPKKTVRDESTITHVYKRLGEYTAKLLNRSGWGYRSLSAATQSALDSVKITVAEEEDEEEDDDNEGSSSNPNSASRDSCTTPYQSKSVAHGAYVSGYSPYFWQGAMPLTVVSPAKQCQDGAWKQVGYCNVNGVSCVSL